MVDRLEAVATDANLHVCVMTKVFQTRRFRVRQQSAILE